LVKAPYLTAKHVTNLSGMSAFRFVLRVLRDVTKMTDETKARAFFDSLNKNKPLKEFLPAKTTDADYTEGFDRYVSEWNRMEASK